MGSNAVKRTLNVEAALPRPVDVEWLRRNARGAALDTDDLSAEDVCERPWSDEGGADGVNSVISRLRVGKANFIVKRAPMHNPAALRDASLMRWYEREVRFYSELAAEAGVRSPACAAAALAPAAGDFVLVLEDLGSPAGRWVPASADGVSGDQAAAAIRALGGMHGRCAGPKCGGNNATLAAAEASWLPVMPVHLQLAPFIASFASQAWEVVKVEFASELAETPEILPLAERLGGVYAALTASLAEPPRTLLHGDYRAENLLFSPTQDEVVVFDWQFVSSGRGAYDLAYFLALSLQPEVRREREEALRELYLAAWAQASSGDEGAAYTREALDQDMRAAVLLAFASFVMGAASNGRQPQFRELHARGLRRLAAAALDWEAHLAVEGL